MKQSVDWLVAGCVLVLVGSSRGRTGHHVATAVAYCRPSRKLDDQCDL